MKAEFPLQTLHLVPPADILIEEHLKQNLYLNEEKNILDKSKFIENPEEANPFIASCICAIKKGFIVGFSGIGLLLMYNIASNDDVLEL